MCLVQLGTPDPDVTWYKNGKKVKSRKDPRIKANWDMKTDIYSLDVKDIISSDYGEYAVKVENELGVLKHSVNVSNPKEDTVTKDVTMDKDKRIRKKSQKDKESDKDDKNGVKSSETRPHEPDDIIKEEADLSRGQASAVSDLINNDECTKEAGEKKITDEDGSVISKEGETYEEKKTEHDEVDNDNVLNKSITEAKIEQDLGDEVNIDEKQQVQMSGTLTLVDDDSDKEVKHQKVKDKKILEKTTEMPEEDLAVAVEKDSQVEETLTIPANTCTETKEQEKQSSDITDGTIGEDTDMVTSEANKDKVTKPVIDIDKYLIKSDEKRMSSVASEDELIDISEEVDADAVVKLVKQMSVTESRDDQPVAKEDVIVSPKTEEKSAKTKAKGQEGDIHMENVDTIAEVLTEITMSETTKGKEQITANKEDERCVTESLQGDTAEVSATLENAIEEASTFTLSEKVEKFIAEAVSVGSLESSSSSSLQILSPAETDDEEIERIRTGGKPKQIVKLVEQPEAQAEAEESKNADVDNIKKEIIDKVQEGKEVKEIKFEEMQTEVASEKHKTPKKKKQVEFGGVEEIVEKKTDQDQEESQPVTDLKPESLIVSESGPVNESDSVVQDQAMEMNSEALITAAESSQKMVKQNIIDSAEEDRVKQKGRVEGHPDIILDTEPEVILTEEETLKIECKATGMCHATGLLHWPFVYADDECAFCGIVLLKQSVTVFLLTWRFTVCYFQLFFFIWNAVILGFLLFYLQGTLILFCLYIINSIYNNLMDFAFLSSIKKCTEIVVLFF